jgi:hypothetical protein
MRAAAALRLRPSATLPRTVCRVVRPAQILNETVEASLCQNPIYPLVERVAGRPRQIRRRDPQPILHSTSSSQRHPPQPPALFSTLHYHYGQLRDEIFQRAAKCATGLGAHVTHP